MPALTDFQTGLTFRDLILRVAETFNMAPSGPDGRTIPTNADHLDWCKRVVNDAYSRVQSAHNAWRALRPLVAVNLSNTPTGDSIGGTNYRYRLPRYVRGQPSGPWVPLDDNLAIMQIGVRPYLMLRRWHYEHGSTGKPAFAAVGFDSEGLQRGGPEMELVVYPAPDRTYTIAAKFIVRSDKLVDLDDRHLFGAELDFLILDACRLEGAIADDGMTGASPGLRQEWMARYTDSLRRAITIDAQREPPLGGVWHDPSVRAKHGRPYGRAWDDSIIQIDGNPV